MSITSVENDTIEIGDRSRHALDAVAPGLALEKQAFSVPLSSAAPIQESSDMDPKTPKPAPPGIVPPFQRGSGDGYQPKTLRFWLIMLSNFASIFLVALDRTILPTAIPSITNEFGSLGDIGWYGSAYMLTMAAFQLLFGRLYRFYDLKWTLICSIMIFEVGSILCGAAPSSRVFILGRAVAGLGSAGIFTGGMLVIIPMVPLHKRPVFQSIFGIVFGVAAVAGPVLGGAFAEKTSWRWCFYINVPTAGVASICLFFLLKSPKSPGGTKPSLLQQLLRLDPLGTCLFVASVTCLVLALQWGGSIYPWGNWRLILLMATCGLTAIGFGAVQAIMPESASLPLRVIKQRSVWAGAWFVFFLYGSLMLCAFYIPFWFQTSQGVDPVNSGVFTLPLVLSMVIASIISSIVTQRMGYYVPSMLVCPCFMSIGQGLLTTLTPTTGSSHWIGYQFLVGFGIGFGMQTANLAVQTTLPQPDIPTGVAIAFFAQQLGGAVFVSVGQTILSSLLVSKLDHVPGLSRQSILEQGATELHRLVPEQFQGAVVDAYNHACSRIFIVGTALSCAQLLFAFAMEWKSIKKHKHEIGSEGRVAATEAKNQPVT